jgi:hypothetical protein
MNYFCPECGYEGDDPVCPHCRIPTEKLDFTDDMVVDEETYPDDVLQKVGGDTPDIVPLDEDLETGKGKDLDEEI